MFWLTACIDTLTHRVFERFMAFKESEWAIPCASLFYDLIRLYVERCIHNEYDEQSNTTFLRIAVGLLASL